MTVKKPFKLDHRTIPNGAVLILHIRYENTEPGGDTRGRTIPKTWTYAALKTGGLWYLTGSGRVPQAAGWAAVERWLERDGRVLVRVNLLRNDVCLWDHELPDAPVERRPGSNYATPRQSSDWPETVSEDDPPYYDLPR